MKNIAVFCDGTWNHSDATDPTNVVRLAQAVSLGPGEGPAQVAIYVPGVGTGRGITMTGRGLDRVLGGAFGLGLNLTLEDAYRALVFAHEPGDRLYLFGFSRGAYMARSLAGLLRASGLPPRRNLHRIPEAVRRYRSVLARTHPSHESSHRFRLEVSPEVTTGRAEVDWRAQHGHPAGVPLDVAYLGVWDTVGALGVPAQYRLLAGLLNGPHQFHDTALSSLVRAARHAVAIDERRRTFEPALWSAESLADLNARASAGTRPYRQEWFPGTHGGVGGGGDITVLSDRALLWVARGAEEAGLRFDADRLPPDDGLPDPEAPLRNRRAPPSLSEKVLGLTATDRKGPDDLADLAPETTDRWRRNPLWRPATLRKLREALGGQAG